MAGSPKKKARKEAIENGTHVPSPPAGTAAANALAAARQPTETETAEACRELADGTPLETVWALLGVGRSTGRRWIDLGLREPAGPYGDFARRVRAARELGFATLRDRIVDAGREALTTEETYDANGQLVKRKVSRAKGDWKATLWALEHQDPSRFSTRTIEVVDRELGAVFEVLQRELDPETYDRILGEIANLGTLRDPL